MKVQPVAILGSVLALTLGGCATISTDESAISRFVRVPAGELSKSVAETAAKRGFRSMDDGRFEKVIIYQKDPVLGLVTVSDKASLAVRFSMRIETVTEKTCRLTVFPVTAVRNPFSGNYSEKPLSPGGSVHTEITSLIDAAIADALAEYEKHTAGPTS
jgi:hypothetical protein